MTYTICPTCRELVVVRRDGRIAWHYPAASGDTGPACAASLVDERAALRAVRCDR